MTTTPEVKSHKTTISIPPVLQERGVELMRAEGFSTFSALVQALIRQAYATQMLQRR